MTTVDAADFRASVAALAPLISEHAAASERERALATPVVEALRDAGVFHAFVPRALGGAEMEPARFVEVLETLASADGSTGWIAMIGSSTALISAYMDDTAARRVFGVGPGVISAGVVAPRGTLTPDGDGYRLSGRWPFASGCAHSSWIGLTGIVDAGNGPDAVMAFVPTADVEIIDTWSVSGLRATGSHDVAVKDAPVAADLTYSFQHSRPRHPGPLYGFSMLGLIGVCVAAVALGIARGALEDIKSLAGVKTPANRRRTISTWSIAQAEVAKAEAEYRAGRALLLESTREMWDMLSRGDRPTDEQRALMRLAASQAVACSVRAVDAAYNLGGGSAIYETSTLQRRFRDIHTVTQHMMVNASSFEAAGRVLLGQDAPPGFL